jgi:hypothetical protein
MPRKLVGMFRFCVYRKGPIHRMLKSSFYRCNFGWPIAFDHIGTFVSSPLYQGRGVVQHTGYP